MTDRDRLIELLKKADDNASRKLITDYDDAIADNADYLLANGVVKVVRCKDCEFVKPTKIKINGKDLRICDLYKKPCYDDDFCSRGELKELKDNA